ncbi:hypothetical protein ACLQ2K_29990, partial [Streptomyces sp. DT17]
VRAAAENAPGLVRAAAEPTPDLVRAAAGSTPRLVQSVDWLAIAPPVVVAAVARAVLAALTIHRRSFSPLRGDAPSARRGAPLG